VAPAKTTPSRPVTLFSPDRCLPPPTSPLQPFAMSAEPFRVTPGGSPLTASPGPSLAATSGPAVPFLLRESDSSKNVRRDHLSSCCAQHALFNGPTSVVACVTSLELRVCGFGTRPHPSPPRALCFAKRWLVLGSHAHVACDACVSLYWHVYVRAFGDGRWGPPSLRLCPWIVPCREPGR
jgi:hypothetical protein